MPKPTTQLRELARLGATVRLKEIAHEVASINQAFPGIGRVSEIPFPDRSGGETPTRKRKRSKMSAAQKAAVSKRMKAYWAARRKGKKA